MNPAAILALIGDLYAQIATLTERNTALENALAEAQSAQGPYKESRPGPHGMPLVSEA